MAEQVTLWNINLNKVPVVGDFVASEQFLRTTANALAIGRAAAGPAIAGYLATHTPEQRTWKAFGAVTALAATDRMDGDIMRAYKGSLTEEELAAYLEDGADAEPGPVRRLLGRAGLQVPTGKAHFGAWVDQMSDKAFVYPAQAVLAARREISPVHPILKAYRDKRVAGIKSEYGEIVGQYPSASPLARWKAVVEMGGVAIAASPLSAETGPDGSTLTEYAFRAATYLSVKTGKEYAEQLERAMLSVRVSEIRDLIIDGPEQD